MAAITLFPFPLENKRVPLVLAAISTRYCLSNPPQTPRPFFACRTTPLRACAEALEPSDPEYHDVMDWSFERYGLVLPLRTHSQAKFILLRTRPPPLRCCLLSLPWWSRCRGLFLVRGTARRADGPNSTGGGDSFETYKTVWTLFRST